jgi:hypothetical protein
MKFVLRFAVIAALTAAALGCTTTQRAVSGAAVGGVAGFAVAGPIGGAVGAGAGAVTAPLVAANSNPE